MSEKKSFQDIIDGKARLSASEELLDIVKPATGEVYATAPNSGREDVDAACRAAARAFESYRWTTPE